MAIKVVNTRILPAVCVLTLFTSTTVHAAPFDYTVSSFTKYFNGLRWQGGAQRVIISYPRNCEFLKLSYQRVQPDDPRLKDLAGRTDVVEDIVFPRASCSGYLTITNPTGKTVCDGYIHVSLAHPKLLSHPYGAYSAQEKHMWSYQCYSASAGLAVPPSPGRLYLGRRSNPQ